MEIRECRIQDVTVGQQARLTVEVTAADVARFVELSGDCSPVHVDDDYARRKGFPGRIVHGMLLGAYVSALVGRLLPGRHGILQSCALEFRRPVAAPARIEIVGEVVNVSAGTGQVQIRIQVVDGAGQLVASGLVRSILREPAAVGEAERTP
jgi:acyl dehydratase